MRDWRKKIDYQFPDDFPDYRWAWEFLRRNPEYRQDWTDTLSRIAAREGEFTNFPRIEEPTGDNMVRLTSIRCVDPDHPDFYIPVNAKHRWGLTSGLLNPNTDAPDRLSFTGLGLVMIFDEKMSHRLSPAGLRFPWAVFDFALPLKPQIDAVYATLEREQKRSTFKPRIVKHHRAQWPHYLRLLDAVLDGRTRRQIADVLLDEIDGPDEGKLWDQLKKAKEMTKPSGYLSIFRSSMEISAP
jgi:hypothetical protein